MTEAECNANLDKIHHQMKGMNTSAAKIVNLTGSVNSEANQDKVTAMVDKMTNNLDELVDNLLLISGLEDDGNAIDSVEKLLEGLEIFLDSTNPELERNNEVGNEILSGPTVIVDI